MNAVKLHSRRAAIHIRRVIQKYVIQNKGDTQQKGVTAERDTAEW